MWHEARKQEKVLRKVIVDYRRRAERRHEYYDKIKQDPTKFMQVHGKRCKLFIDETNQSSDSCHMMPWQGDKSNMIDRFDVRAHLDFINEPKPSNQTKSLNDKEERRLNYERYRILVYNKHKNVSESQHLHKIHVNESYPDLNAQKLESEAKKQQLATTKASIGFDYGADVVGGAAEVEEEDSSDSDEDFMFDLEDIPPLRELNPDDLEDIEKFSLEFGMGYTDFVRSMDQDQEMQERIDKAREVESEKQKMAGKKSRRERRMLRDERLKDRVIGPLSYMQKGSGNESETESESSDEEHPSCEGKIEFITSFGADNGNAPDRACAAPPTDKPNKSAPARHKLNSHSRRSRSRGRRSRSTSRGRRSRSRSRRSLSRGRRSRSRSNDRGRSCSRDKIRSRESYSRGHRSRSREKSPHFVDRRSHVVTRKDLTNMKPAPGSSAVDLKKLTPQEKLKIRMQRALKKQLKADHAAMEDKRAQVYNEQMEREEDLREMTRKMRRQEEDRYNRDSPHGYHR